MKPLNEEELYQNLCGFLKAKGIDLQEGSYARGIKKSCSLLSDAINLGQQGLGKAKVEIDKKLDQVRQVIHEKTAPRTGSGSSAGKPPKASAGGSSHKSAAGKAATRKKSPKGKSR
ncbi:MAG TPA: hypothetical protein VL361_13035 [Candidatus Limnocylindrales bacterium]|jgi:hypothetical protein|nr:hypothetical protein [Candidatus Limnocylindrales bacterium]